MTTCYPTTIRALTAQGYRHLPRALRCAHGLSQPFWCRTCRQLPHRDGCEFTGLDHAVIAARDGARYLFTWIYADPADADTWAADYANRHSLHYRINHPDDLAAYCPGVVSVRYHRKPKPGNRSAIMLPNLRIAAGVRHHGTEPAAGTPPVRGAGEAGRV